MCVSVIMMSDDDDGDDDDGDDDDGDDDVGSDPIGRRLPLETSPRFTHRNNE